MKNLSDTHTVQQALMNSPGVMDVTTSLEHQTVTIRLRDPEGLPLVKRTLDDAGYPAVD
jgi:copper chaperone CopZ